MNCSVTSFLAIANTSVGEENFGKSLHVANHGESILSTRMALTTRMALILVYI